jgi:epoxyqueuosine reductase QueG
MSKTILQMLSIYEKVGIAVREKLNDVPSQYNPQNIMQDYQSIIVLARVPKDVAKENVIGKYHYAIGTIAAQDAVIKYLIHHGYKYDIIGSRAKNISLPRLGERAGVGELSPFRTLAVKGWGLRTVLSAIITDAPLIQTTQAIGACTDKSKCLKTCPALGKDGVFDRTKCTSCGACVKKCPN